MSVSYPEASTKTSTARKTGREFALPSSGVKLPVDSQPAEVIDSWQDEVGKPPCQRPRWRRWSAEFRAATTKRWSTRLAQDSA